MIVKEWIVFKHASLRSSRFELLFFQKQPLFYIKKLFWQISQNSQENTCVGGSFYQRSWSTVWMIIEKEIPARVFSFAFCYFFQNTFRRLLLLF